MDHFPIFFLSAFLLLLSVSGQRQYFHQPTCKWELTLKTGGDNSAATEATIGIDIHRDVEDGHFPIFNLKRHGTRTNPNYRYFQRNQVDLFRFAGPCEPFLCRMSFYNSGTGQAPAWFLVYAAAKITIPGIGDVQRNTTVNTWLSDSFYPHSWDITVDYCQRSVTPGAKAQSKTIN